MIMTLTRAEQISQQLTMSWVILFLASSSCRSSAGLLFVGLARKKASTKLLTMWFLLILLTALRHCTKKSQDHWHSFLLLEVTHRGAGRGTTHPPRVATSTVGMHTGLQTKLCGVLKVWQPRVENEHFLNPLQYYYLRALTLHSRTEFPTKVCSSDDQYIM